MKSVIFGLNNIPLLIKQYCSDSRDDLFIPTERFILIGMKP